MKIQTIIPDADCQRIIARGGKRVRGSIAMLPTGDFEFRAFAPTPPSEGSLPRRTLRLRHGHATVAPDLLKLRLVIRRTAEPCPVDVLYDETDDAVEFIAANVGEL